MWVCVGVYIYVKSLIYITFLCKKVEIRNKFWKAVFVNITFLANGKIKPMYWGKTLYNIHSPTTFPQSQPFFISNNNNSNNIKEPSNWSCKESGCGGENRWLLQKLSGEQGQENRKQSQLSCRLFELSIDYLFHKSIVPKAQISLTNNFKKHQGCLKTVQLLRSISVSSLTFIFCKHFRTPR